jgi:hypothetical protein
MTQRVGGLSQPALHPDFDGHTKVANHGLEHQMFSMFLKELEIYIRRILVCFAINT